MVTLAEPLGPSVSPSLGVTTTVHTWPLRVAVLGSRSEVETSEVDSSTRHSKLYETGEPSGSMLSISMVVTRSSVVVAGMGASDTLGMVGR